MKTYYVLWQYIANFNSEPWEIRAESPEQAAEKLRSNFRPEFSEKGRVLVFDQPPAYIWDAKEAKNDT